MNKDCCGLCKHWLIRVKDQESGLCRAEPPRVAANLQSMFPTTNRTTLCGAFVLGEGRTSEVSVPEPMIIVPLAPKFEAPAPDPSDPRVTHPPVMHINKLAKFRARVAPSEVGE